MQSPGDSDSGQTRAALARAWLARIADDLQAHSINFAAFRASVGTTLQALAVRAAREEEREKRREAQLIEIEDGLKRQAEAIRRLEDAHTAQAGGWRWTVTVASITTTVIGLVLALMRAWGKL